MELELRITSYQRLSPAVISTKCFSSAQAWTIGRSESCDWHLPDPGKVVSSRHAEIRAGADGRFQIRDTSTNGVFINDSPDPLGRDGEATLAEGDRLRLGDYELAVSLKNDAGSIAAPEVTDLPSSAPEPLLSESTVVTAPDPEPVTEGAAEHQASLASGLNERFLGDSHVEMPRGEIPDQWDWGAVTAPETGSVPADEQQPTAPAPLQALLEGLGLTGVDPASLSESQCRALGILTRSLLDRLLDLLHMRARQKQQLRVTQTLFQRSENNPLKFSATASDALDGLLFRRHPSFLGPEAAVGQAFEDIVSHERALMAGVESVVSDLLQPPEGGDTAGLWGARRRLAAVRQQRERQQDDYGDLARLLRSDAFVDAYEQAVSGSERE